jgi:hypothetical protein
MLNKKIIDSFLNKSVSVGVPHIILPDRLFFYYGRLHEVTGSSITLETKQGFKIVPIEQIKDLHEDERSH